MSTQELAEKLHIALSWLPPKHRHPARVHLSELVALAEGKETADWAMTKHRKMREAAEARVAHLGEALETIASGKTARPHEQVAADALVADAEREDKFGGDRPDDGSDGETSPLRLRGTVVPSGAPVVPGATDAAREGPVAEHTEEIERDLDEQGER